MALTLTFAKRIDIKDKSAGLTEPSGLALSHDRKGLWTVSDDTATIFKLTLDGAILPDASFDVPDTGLEGITIDPDGRHLFAVREESNEIITLGRAENWLT